MGSLKDTLKRMKSPENEARLEVAGVKESILGILLIFYFAGSLALPAVYSFGGVIFAVIGLFFLLRRSLGLASLLQPTFAGKLPLVFMAFAAVGASINLLHFTPAGQYEMYIPFLWAPLIFLAVLDGQIDRRFIWIGCALGAIFACALALYQSIYLGSERPSGFLTSPISFGNNALLLGAVALAGRHDPPFRLRKPVWLAFTYVAFFFGLAASLTTQSKGGWPLVPVVLFWVLVEDFWRASKRERLSLAIVAVAFVSLLPLMPINKSVERINDAATGAIQWFRTGEIVELSAAPRLELWNAGLKIWSEKPWLGHSQEGVSERILEKIALNEVNAGVGHIGALHNEALQLLAENGLVGLLSWVSMYAASFLVFWRAYLQPDPVQKKLGQAGLIILTASFIFGLSDTYIRWNANRQLFVCLMMTMAALLVAAKRKPA